MSAAPIRILAIEDNPGDARLLQELLKEAGAGPYEINFADTLAAGMDRLSEYHPDVVLLDLGLPDSQGLDTLTRLRGADSVAAIVICTGLSDEATGIAAVHQGAQDYLHKGEVDGRGLWRTISYALERRRLEEENRTLQERLLRSQKIEAIGQLAGGIAHDFNNMLTPIIGYCDMLLTQTGEKSIFGQDIIQIKNAGERAARLVKRLLAFTRQEPTSIGPLNLNATVQSVDNLLRQLIGEDINLVTILEPEPKTILADTGLIEQATINLVVNARDAMPSGGSLLVKTQRVTVDEGYLRTTPQAVVGDYMVLSVQDGGCGMSKEVLAHIFEPFFTTKKPGEGVGLGLAIVYSVMELHKGWINVYSEPGKGTMFNLYFPATPEKGALAESQSEEPRVPKGAGERILLVEDEAAVRNFALKLLTNNGYQVTATATAGQAYGAFLSAEGKFDLVFSDVVLPDEPGATLVERLKKVNPRLMVIISSGYDSHKFQIAAVQEAGHMFLNKPYGSVQQLKAIREVLDKGRDFQ